VRGFEFSKSENVLMHLETQKQEIFLSYKELFCHLLRKIEHGL
jgi:hypothetical protein